MINLDIFFRSVRKSVFHGSLTKGQVDGMERIVNYWQTQWNKMPLDEFSYLMATIAHETAYRMQPVKEMGGEAYLRSKRYYPYFGVGLIQATWKRNWDRLGIKSVEDGLQWPSALHAAFYGMAAGIYTGKKLADYIGHGQRDYVNARRIINGVDRAQDIANVANSFRAALIAAQQADEPAPIPKPWIDPGPPMPDAPIAALDYAEFKAMLIKMLEEDPDVRGVLQAVLFPEQPEPEELPYNENDAPHDDYGSDQPEYAYADDELDQRYG